LLGFWIFGFRGALIGIVIGLLIQFGNKKLTNLITLTRSEQVFIFVKTI